LITPDLVVAFLTLTFLEIVLGIDNIIFISILADHFPVDKQKKIIKTP
jgi:predicted tellurium resistance membrane protein TerC